LTDIAYLNLIIIIWITDYLIILPLVGAQIICTPSDKKAHMWSSGQRGQVIKAMSTLTSSNLQGPA